MDELDKIDLRTDKFCFVSIILIFTIIFIKIMSFFVDTKISDDKIKLLESIWIFFLIIDIIYFIFLIVIPFIKYVIKTKLKGGKKV